MSRSPPGACRDAAVAAAGGAPRGGPAYRPGAQRRLPARCRRLSTVDNRRSQADRPADPGRHARRSGRLDEAFDAVFGEATFAGKVPDPEEDRAPRERPPQPDGAQPLDMTGGAASGRTAAADHLTGRKSFGERRRGGAANAGDPGAAAGRLADRAQTPARRVGPRQPHRPCPHRPRGPAKLWRDDRLMREQRPPKPRRLLILIDVSGSMKAHSETALRLAHLATRRLPKVETFCFGTRLTAGDGDAAGIATPTARSPALSGLVFDFDGGTLIGAFARKLPGGVATRRAGARRDHRHLLRRAGARRPGSDGRLPSPGWRASARRLIWATPLAADPRYRPATRAMAAVLPSLDALCDGSSLAALGRLLDALEGIDNGAARPRRRPFRARKARRMIPIVDAHHHIWRQADLPWLQGPMVPRIFGPYEPIRRDYPIEEYPRRHCRDGRGEIRLRPGQLGEGPCGGRGRLGAEHWRRARLSAGDRRLCGPGQRGRPPDADGAGGVSGECAAYVCNCTGTRTSCTASPPHPT